MPKIFGSTREMHLTNDVPDAPALAIDSLAAYARKYQSWIESGQRHIAILAGYGTLVDRKALIANDAKVRWAQLEAAECAVLDAKMGIISPLVSLAGFQDQLTETRWSLLLAAFLDPDRVGTRLAAAFWEALLSLPELGPHCHDPAGVAQRVRLGVNVHPKSIGAEIKDQDVFAEMTSDPTSANDATEVGLVIENKVWASEQADQCDRYFAQHGGAERDVTVFVFLTPDGRQPRTAVKSRSAWRAVSWAKFVELFTGLASHGSLLIGERVLCLQFARLIDQAIYGRDGSLAWLTAIGRVRARLSSCVDMAAHHQDICAIQLPARSLT